MKEIPEYVKNFVYKKMKEVNDKAYKQGKMDCFNVIISVLNSMDNDFFKKENIINYLKGLRSTNENRI